MLSVFKTVIPATYTKTFYMWKDQPMNSNEPVKLSAVPIQNKIHSKMFLNGFRRCFLVIKKLEETTPKCHSIKQTEIYIHTFGLYTALPNIRRA